jgi:RimJ/RimL family protein N-acetyltransferase
VIWRGMKRVLYDGCKTSIGGLTMGQIKIVPIDESQVSGFHLALDIVAREKKFLAWLEAPPIESTRKYILNNIRNDHAQFVVLDKEKVVGWCDIIPADRPVLAHSGELGMALLPAYRGRGIGSDLLRTTLRKAKEKGLERVELAVYASNHAARALYKKIGFKEEGVKRRAAKIDGRYEDDCLMALFLAEVEL